MEALQGTTEEQHTEHQRRSPEQDKYDDHRNLDKLDKRAAHRISLRRERTQRRRRVQLVLKPAERTARHRALPFKMHLSFAPRTNRFGMIHTLRVAGMPQLKHKTAAPSAINNRLARPRAHLATATADRGRDGGISATPPSEPDRRISRIRLSSQWVRNATVVRVHSCSASKQSSPRWANHLFGQR